ncbi:hypothetical protein [Streptomyces sp. NPDC051016]|uniref:hypothetical protein n=1 Tax=Streptomyces sp. NPDC051016 TaxID=3365638 RepID=UPI003796D1FB
MTATGYVSTTGDTRKVNKAGDTMSGDLVLPDNAPDTDLSAASKGYVLAQVAGAGTGVASDTVATETSFGQPSAAGVSATYSRGDHTHGTPASPGGGGSTIRTADVRITAGDVALAATGTWTVVTSGATKLACSVTAAAGDRIQAGPSFMRNGSGAFLDLAILTSAGAISRYLGSGTSSPLPEGNPAYYPQAASFPAAESPVQIVVASGEVDGNGKATIALVYTAGAAETIYAGATYPFYMLLTNYGPEPS